MLDLLSSSVSCAVRPRASRRTCASNDRRGGVDIDRRAALTKP